MVGTVIAYPDLRQLAIAHDLQVKEVLTSLRVCLRAAYGSRVGILSREHRRQCLDLHRFISVLDHLDLIGGLDVLAVGHRCPTRIRRYDQALIQLIARAVHHGAPMSHVLIVERTHKVLSRVTEEVSTFYQGLS